MRSNILGWRNKQKHTNSYEEIGLRKLYAKHPFCIVFALYAKSTQQIHRKIQWRERRFLRCGASKTTLLMSHHHMDHEKVLLQLKQIWQEANPA